MLQSLIKQKLTLELKNGFYVKFKKYFKKLPQGLDADHALRGGPKPKNGVNNYYLFISPTLRSHKGVVNLPATRA
jgi:hypothetical protein